MAEGDTQKDAITLYMDGVKTRAKELEMTGGALGKKTEQFIREMEIAMRARAAASPEFEQSIKDLVLYRKDTAKKSMDNVLSLGKQAADGEIQALSGLDAAKSQTVSLANATNIENEGIVQKSRAGWSAFWGNVADFFQGIPGCDFITDFCREREERYAPRVIKADTSQNDQTKKTIAIDPKSAVGRAMSTVSASLLFADNDTVGLNGKTFKHAHAEMDEASEAMANAPTALKDLPGTALPAEKLPPKSAAAASVGSIESFAKQVIDKVSKESKLDQDKIDKLTKGIIIADTMKGGNKDGKLDANEGVTLHNNEAYKSLTADQKTVLDKHLGIDAAGKPLVPAGPAPALH